MHGTRSEGDQSAGPRPPIDQLEDSEDSSDLTEKDGAPLAEISATSDPVGAVYGSLGLKESTDAIIRALRGPPDTV